MDQLQNIHDTLFFTGSPTNLFGNFQSIYAQYLALKWKYDFGKSLCFSIKKCGSQQF